MAKGREWSMLTTIFAVDYTDQKPPSKGKVLAYYRRTLPLRQFKAVDLKKSRGFRIMERRW